MRNLFFGFAGMVLLGCAAPGTGAGSRGESAAVGALTESVDYDCGCDPGAMSPVSDCERGVTPVPAISITENGIRIDGIERPLSAGTPSLLGQNFVTFDIISDRALVNVDKDLLNRKQFGRVTTEGDLTGDLEVRPYICRRHEPGMDHPQQYQCALAWHYNPTVLADSLDADARYPLSLSLTSAVFDDVHYADDISDVFYHDNHEMFPVVVGSVSIVASEPLRTGTDSGALDVYADLRDSPLAPSGANGHDLFASYECSRSRE